MKDLSTDFSAAAISSSKPRPGGRTGHSVGVVSADCAFVESFTQTFEAQGFWVISYPSTEIFLTEYSSAGLMCAVLDLSLPETAESWNGIVDKFFRLGLGLPG